METKFKCDENKCIRCGICTRVCPKGLIHFSNETPVMDKDVSARCNNCGQCVAFCPTGAARQVFSEGMHLSPAWDFSAESTPDLLSFLKSRRSYRTYQPTPVKHETLVNILETANYAPSGGNNRKLRWIVLEDPSKTRELAEKISVWFDKEARYHPVYGKRYAIDSILERYRAGKDVILRGAPHVAFAVGPSNHVWGPVDAGIALIYFNLACEANDIGCCFAGYATRAAESEDVRKFLGIQEGETVWCAICFGNKTLHAVRIPNRGKVPLTLI